jgi:type III pantothenate kinase
MKLVLDIGNTKVKAGVFEKKQLIEIISSTVPSVEFIDGICRKNKGIASVILSSVREVPFAVIDLLKKNYYFIEFSDTTPVPVTNLYRSPTTLGKDRLAGVVAAGSLYPNENVLVIDAGTCITYDFINAAGEYNGGSISPGFSMRFKALHTFTGQLPLVSLENYYDLIGTDTETSILSGVVNGLTAEADAIINLYKKLYNPIRTVICGGDMKFLADRLKNSIFAVSELVLIGLNEILDHNEL